MDKKKKWKKQFLCLAGILLIFGAIFFHSSPLSQKGEISLENFVYCHIQTMRVENETGIGRAVKIRDLEQVENLVKTIGNLEVRKALPWEKLHSDEEYPYTMHLQFDSEEVGRYELIHFWKSGEIIFRGDSYMIADGSKTQMTDQLEWLLQNYEIEK